MDNTNFFTSKFGKKSMRERKLQKVYFQRKINTENYPKYKNVLKTFFNDCSKYFDTSFDENHIIVGKKYNLNQKLNIPISLTESGNQKLRNKKFFKKPTLRRTVMMRSDSINRSRITHDDKKKSFEENILKPGQRFIEDKEIDKLFNLYRELRRINKYRSNNFINMKELKELKESKNENNFNIKSSENFFKLNSSPILNNSNKEKKSGTFVLRNNIDINNINNESEYNRTISTNIGGNIFDEPPKNNNNFKSIEPYKEGKKGLNCKTDVIKNRKKLIKRQNQYIYKNIELSLKNQFSELLASQENVFLCQKQDKKFQNNFKSYLNTHLKKKNNERLLLQDDTYRNKLELKMKIDFFQNKLNPDRIYDWYYDLHSSKSIFPIIDTKFEIIRNPKNMNNIPNIRSKTFEKNDYLRNIITTKYYKNLEKEIHNINNNYGGLYVEGKNLLKFENNMAKKLKGRKIINDFERLMSPSDLKSENYYSNLNKKI